MMVCEACNGQGWLLADNSDHGLRIERCDACEQFDCDENAVKYVAEIAMGVDRLTTGDGPDVVMWNCTMCGMNCMTTSNSMSIWQRIVHHLRTVHKMAGMPVWDCQGNLVVAKQR